MDALETLTLAVNSAGLPGEGTILFLNARPHPALAAYKDRLTCVQPFKPFAEMLERAGFTVSTSMPENLPFDAVLIDVPKQVTEAQGLIADGLLRVKSNGLIIAAAANDANGARLPKWFKELGLSPETLSKNRAKAVFCCSYNPDIDVIMSWKYAALSQTLVFADTQKYLTKPGLFSYDRIDKGTEFLLQHIPQQISGIGADFGCGIGVLSRSILSSPNRITTWHALEADARALDCCRDNLSGSNIDVTYHWADLTRPVHGLPPLDVIVMNPPFHEGKGEDAGIGKGFIRTTAASLKKGGVLYMVANAHLPYEAFLSECFARHEKTAQDKGFKILKAVK